MEHNKDDAIKIGLNYVGTEDERDNAASSLDQPTLSNRVVSMDVKMKPTENIFLNAEVARSDTDLINETTPVVRKEPLMFLKAVMKEKISEQKLELNMRIQSLQLRLVSRLETIKATMQGFIMN